MGNHRVALGEVVSGQTYCFAHHLVAVRIEPRPERRSVVAIRYDDRYARRRSEPGGLLRRRDVRMLWRAPTPSTCSDTTRDSGPRGHARTQRGNGSATRHGSTARSPDSPSTGCRAPTLVFTHTEVDDAFEGKGVASRLIRGALDDVRRNRSQSSPGARSWPAYIRDHPACADLQEELGDRPLQPRHLRRCSPHAEFERLRTEDPVHWQAMPDGTGYWAVLRHADVMEVAAPPEGVLGRAGRDRARGSPTGDARDDARHAAAMDPPRHLDHRRNVLRPRFTPAVIGDLEARIRPMCRDLRRRRRRHGRVRARGVAALPSQVVGELMGLPREDWPKIHAWSEQNSGGQDPDIAASAGDEACVRRSRWRCTRSSSPGAARPTGDDLMTYLLACEVDGHTMTDIEFGSFFVQLVTAGNDTTRTMLSSGLLALLAHPDQLEALRADSGLIPSAVEEMLRCPSTHRNANVPEPERLTENASDTDGTPKWLTNGLGEDSGHQEKLWISHDLGGN